MRSLAITKALCSNGRAAHLQGTPGTCCFLTTRNQPRMPGSHHCHHSRILLHTLQADTHRHTCGWGLSVRPGGPPADPRTDFNCWGLLCSVQHSILVTTPPVFIAQALRTTRAAGCPCSAKAGSGSSKQARCATATCCYVASCAVPPLRTHCSTDTSPQNRNTSMILLGSSTGTAYC